MTTSKLTPDIVRAALLDLSAAAPGRWFTAAEIADAVNRPIDLGATSDDVRAATSGGTPHYLQGEIDLGYPFKVYRLR